MNKKEVQARILLNGKPLLLDRFKWDSKTKTFTSDVNRLVIDFTGFPNCTFNTGAFCMFRTSSQCTFKTRGHCIFNTGYGCTFETGTHCVFIAEGSSTFKTGYGCTFIVSSVCTWKYDWGELKQPPLHFSGSQYFIEFSRPGYIRSGCVEESVSWWQHHVASCAREYNYKPEQVKEYKLYVELLVEWMRQNHFLSRRKRRVE